MDSREFAMDGKVKALAERANPLAMKFLRFIQADDFRFEYPQNISLVKNDFSLFGLAIFPTFFE